MRGVPTIARSHPPAAVLRALPLLALVLALAGCLPSSGSRQQTGELFPADSLSRQIAEAAPVDTLVLDWRAAPPAEAGFGYATTMAALPSGRFVVADTRGGGLHVFEGGAYAGAFASSAFRFPFLAGTRGDTVAVLNRGADRLDLVLLGGPEGGRIVAQIPLPDGRNQTALLTEDGVLYKTTGEKEGPLLRRLDRQGREVARYTLRGPYWRHLGFLRPWGDSLLSLSGYRPVVDVLTPATQAGAALDTLALAGFDSPQLARSRLFALGDVKEPPLLAPAASAAGDRLFVLNARSGWVHVDVFARDDGPEGPRLLLERSLVSPDAAFHDDFFAADLAVRHAGAGYEIAVLIAGPEPAVEVYRWVPETDAVAAR